MSKIADAEANATSLDGLVNDNGLITTLRNGPKPSYQYLVDGWNSEFDALIDNFEVDSQAAIIEMQKSRGFRVVGTFADGFTYELANDVGIDASGNPWIYNGALPFTVTAGTTPTSPNYTQVFYGVASQVSTNTSDTVQSFVDSFALKIFQSPTDGGLTEIQTRTVNGGEVYEVRKTSDNSLATIYRDAAGKTEIVQNGTSNVSDSDGVVEFYIADGDYTVTINSVSAVFKTLTASSVSLAIKESLRAKPPSVQDVTDWCSVYVEEFRGDGFSDSETIQAALDYVGSLPYTGVNLTFEQGRTYIYNAENSIKNINNININLNGSTLKRADGDDTSALLTQEVTVSDDTVINLGAVPSNWKVGEYITAFTSDSDADTNRDRRRITAINGNQVTITAPFFFSPSKTTLPIGTRVAKAFSCFAGRPSSTDSTTFPLTAGVNERVFISNGIIDGNVLNQYNYSWRFCVEVAFNGLGGLIEKVTFKNTAGEAFVGHGTTIKDCVYEDCYGSVYHTSLNDETLADAGFAWFINNTCKRIGLATQAKNGHSEGAITFSWGAGNFIVKDNILEDLTNYFIGSFSPSTGVNADKFLMVSGNIVKNAKGIFDAVNEPALDVHITDNIFHDCGNNLAKTKSLSENPVCSFNNNTLSGTTTAVQRTYSNQITAVGTGQVKNRRGEQAAYIANSIIPNFSPSVLAGTVTISENAGRNFHSMLSTAMSGIAHYVEGGSSSGSAFYQYDPDTKKTSMGTNIVDGSVDLRVGLFQTKLRASSDGVELLGFNGFYMGDKDTDGSWRIMLANGDLKHQKRVAGTWVTKQTVSGA